MLTMQHAKQKHRSMKTLKKHEIQTLGTLTSSESSGVAGREGYLWPASELILFPWQRLAIVDPRTGGSPTSTAGGDRPPTPGVDPRVPRVDPYPGGGTPGYPGSDPPRGGGLPLPGGGTLEGRFQTPRKGGQKPPSGRVKNGVPRKSGFPGWDAIITMSNLRIMKKKSLFLQKNRI
jgi:hypothetical protein